MRIRAVSNLGKLKRGDVVHDALNESNLKGKEELNGGTNDFIGFPRF
jgi:hypothetical protein